MSPRTARIILAGLGAVVLLVFYFIGILFEIIVMSVGVLAFFALIIGLILLIEQAFPGWVDKD